ncbi:MAG: CvpA family protein, partial [Steroidobacteraceae bacterium]
THLGGVLSQEPYGLWAGRALVLVGLLCLGAALGAIAGHFVRLSIFGGTDRLLGFIFGVLRGAVIAGLLVILCHTLRLDQEAWYRNARLRAPAEHIANTVRSLVGEARVEKLLHPEQASRDAAPAS